MKVYIVWTRWMAHSSGVLRGAAFCLEDCVRGKTPEDHRLLELLDPVAEAAGYEIVRLRMMGGEQRRTMQVMAEDAHGEMMVEDCAILSRALSQVLEAADPIPGEYVLEVSSPGVDRPLTRLRDFETYEGHEAKIELDRLAEGRKRFRGVLAGIEDDNVAIDLEGDEDTALLPFTWIIDAKLSLTDDLMKRGAELRAARMEAQNQGDGRLPDENQSESEEEA
jgi:ribosome maturation factor RimP